MTALRRLALAFLAMILLVPAGLGEVRHDPLNQKEIDDLREAHEDADKRLKLFIAYARARLASLEQARADPKTTDRGDVTHQWLTDFLDIYDELDDNVEMYQDRKEDFRRTLKVVIDADTEFQSKLLALRDAAGVSHEEAKQYEFVLTSALETLDTAVESHRQILSQQEEEAKKKKKTK
jgi:hypothetical protein